MTSKTLTAELKEHIPFTLVGSATGIILMLIFNKYFDGSGHKLFTIFHPLHVVLSAFATTMLFRLRAPDSSIIKLFIIGYIGSIGVATVSDSLIPYCGERIMGIAVPREHSHTHADEQPAKEIACQGHSHDEEEDKEHTHLHSEKHIPGEPDIHIGFIEEWKMVNSAALAGIILGIFFTAGKLPHASHVLISTWASMAHIMMNTADTLTFVNYIGIFVVLFIAVWLPCCFSDIVFPTLFSLKVDEKCGCCH